jgi:conjugal transfer/entry exclusion protein
VKELDFQSKLDKKIKDMYKKMKAKKIRDEEKVRKATDKAARNTATDAKRVANRRAKRIREREEEAAAAAAEAREDNMGGLDEDVRLLYLLMFCIQI